MKGLTYKKVDNFRKKKKKMINDNNKILFALRIIRA